MKLLDEMVMSNWAFYQCYNGNDTEEIRSLITHHYWAFCYCRFIKDVPEVRKYINDKDGLKALKRKRSYEVN